jgi:hypothetical protein
MQPIDRAIFFQVNFGSSLFVTGMKRGVKSSVRSAMFIAGDSLAIPSSVGAACKWLIKNYSPVFLWSAFHAAPTELFAS